MESFPDAWWREEARKGEDWLDEHKVLMSCSMANEDVLHMARARKTIHQDQERSCIIIKKGLRCRELVTRKRGSGTVEYASTIHESILTSPGILRNV